MDLDLDFLHQTEPDALDTMRVTTRERRDIVNARPSARPAAVVTRNMSQLAIFRQVSNVQTTARWARKDKFKGLFHTLNDSETVCTTIVHSATSTATQRKLSHLAYKVARCRILAGLYSRVGVLAPTSSAIVGATISHVSTS